ncbi:MAG: ABC-F family ATP-binding cassette domain-containing protein [Lentisphaerae bacterium]|nr:ABC-F family ATP-binding cassette domain-containing protein [Lentisphaerota bacterium]
MAEQIIWSGAELNFAIGTQTIFNQAEFSICEGEKVALVGRNGCGKSTLLSVIKGDLPLQGAVINKMRNLRIASLDQEFTLPGELSVKQAVRNGQEFIYQLLAEYENPATTTARHEEIEHYLTMHDAWHPESLLDEVMDKLRLDRGDELLQNLSGGEKRRVALARAIVSQPDLLLLDEPTNHLDIETVQWIEEFLANYRGTTLLVTHDRFFLDRVANRIVELDHGKFYSVEGSYADFLAFKAEREANEDALEAKRKHFLRSEIEWVRRSPKARLRRNLGRLRRYNEIAAQSGPERTGEVELVIPPGPRLGNMCLEIKNISKSIGGKKLFEPFDLEITPGRKIGVVGSNGCGKTTLLRVITGYLEPDTGSIKMAPQVEFNYIDQGRLVLNEEHTVYEEVAEGRDTIKFGSASLTVRSYLRRFLFEDDRINTHIKYLSGGEKARIILAKILKRGGNFLILDEPTNDLDLSTLRLLEEALSEYDGTILLVSHDRYFLNRICDGIIGLDGSGKVFYTPGDYDYYLQKRPAAAVEEKKPAEKPVTAPPPAAAISEKPKKLSFKEQTEFKRLEEAIPQLEARISEIEGIFQDPDFFNKYGSQSNELNTELEKLKSELDQASERWLELADRM